MARDVAIRVKVDGTDQAVRNIDELETAIEQLKKELKGTAIGSTEFKKLSGELQNAESKLKTLNKSFEGLEPQQKAEAFVKLGEGIAGSFAIATAALTAFGVESEDVQQAQLAITQALTAAVGFRQIAEAGLQARIAATTISQYAYNAAATAGNAITKAFYTTLAANPIGAIVAAVAALAIGIYALISAQEDEIDVQEELNDAIVESSKNSVKYQFELKTLGNIINDNTLDLKVRQAALEDLKAILPELEGLELDNANALNQVNAAIGENIKLSIAQAKTEGLKQYIIKKTQEQIELQNSSLDDNLGFWEEVGNFILSTGNLWTKTILDAQTAAANVAEKNQKLQEQITAAEEAYTKALQEELKLQADVDAGRAGAIEELKKQEKATQQAEKALQNLIKAREDNVRRLVEQIKELGTALNFNYGEPKILADIKALRDELKGLATDKTLESEFRRLFGRDLGEDVFGTFYDDVREKLSGALLQGAAPLQDVVSKTLTEGAAKVQEGTISIEAFVALQNLTKEYQNLQDLIIQFPSLQEVLTDPSGKGTEGYFTALKASLISTGDIIFKELENGQIVLLDAADRDTKTLVEGRQRLVEEEAKLKKAVLERLNEEVKAGNLTQAQAEEIATARVKSITELATAITTQEEEIRGVLFEVQKAQDDILKNNLNIADTTNAAYRKFIQNNLDLVVKQYEGLIDLDEELFDEQKRNRQELAAYEEELVTYLTDQNLLKYKKYFTDRQIEAQDLLDLEAYLTQLSINFEDLSADEKLKIIEAFYNKKKELRDQDAEEEKNLTTEFVDGLADGLQQIAQVAQTGVQVFQQYLQTQLTLLQAEEERILDQIVGDSEEAEQKRTEIKEQYENERKEITKRSQLAQLELTRIQAVANVAEAITKALADGPIIGQILAGISAAIGAIQVGVISTQISQVRNLARGGLLVGNTHENGGIPLAGGGVVAEGGEAVINRRASIDYRGLLNEVSMSSGGAPLINSSFDDTRLIEAITKQNRNPIKAYVLEKEITKSQGINKRLQQLSKI